ncbi:MAG: hypothetical protein KGL74_10405, partial [Elusimicrobia bacterium]|nr:hypothetical protein [Elusimicrobiota bacterium]
MTNLRALLALLLAAPAFSQIRTVPPVAAPVFAAPALPETAAASAGSSLPSLPAAPLLSERAAFELQKDADRLYAALAQVHNRAQAGTPAAELAPAKRAMAADLRGVLTQLPEAPSDWKELSARLKNLRAERAALERAGDDPEARAAGSRRRAQLNNEIYVLQMRAALAQLTGRAPLNA